MATRCVSSAHCPLSSSPTSKSGPQAQFLLSTLLPLKSSSSPWLHVLSICNNSQTMLWSASPQALHKHLPPSQWTHAGVQEQLKLIPCSSPSHWPVFPTSVDSNSITEEAWCYLAFALSLMSKHLPPHPLWPPNPNPGLACLGSFSAPWLVACPESRVFPAAWLVPWRKSTVLTRWSGPIDYPALSLCPSFSPLPITPCWTLCRLSDNLSKVPPQSPCLGCSFHLECSPQIFTWQAHSLPSDRCSNVTSFRRPFLTTLSEVATSQISNTRQVPRYFLLGPCHLLAWNRLCLCCLSFLPTSIQT